MVKIYGLVCPFTGDIRYIGKTVRPLVARLHNHITESKRARHSHKHRWIAKCCDQGLRPGMWLLEEVPDGIRWQERERLWISKAIESGLDLTNQTAGGEGLEFIDTEAGNKYKANLSKASKKNYPKVKTALIDGSKRSWAENRQARIDSCMAGWTDESRARHRETMARVSKTPEFKAAQSAAQKKKWVESRDVIMAAFARPECKKRQSERKKKSWQDPETRRRMANRWTPEARAKQAAELVTRREKMLQARTPESRAKQAEALRATWAKRKAAKS